MGKQTKILVFNGNSDARDAMRSWIREHDPDIALICETGWLERLYEQMGRLYQGPERPSDCSVLLRRRGLARGHKKQLTRRIPRVELPQMWRDRWAVSVHEVWHRTWNISIHANAIIHEDGQWRDNGGAREWRKNGLPALARLIKRGKRWRRAVRIGGDMNFPESRVDDAPNVFFREQGLEFVHHHLMWFAWDPRRENLVRVRILDKAPGADAHKALLVTLEKR